MKHTYNLRIFYMSTAPYKSQYYEKTVDADRFYIDGGGAYVFCHQNGKIIACYPTSNTIIEKIIDNEKG